MPLLLNLYQLSYSIPSSLEPGPPDTGAKTHEAFGCFLLRLAAEQIPLPREVTPAWPSLSAFSLPQNETGQENETQQPSAYLYHNSMPVFHQTKDTFTLSLPFMSFPSILCGCVCVCVCVCNLPAGVPLLSSGVCRFPLGRLKQQASGVGKRVLTKHWIQKVNRK